MDHHSAPQQPAATPVDGTVVSQRRRRFIQAGVVPVGLTLASRPVMAWHCNTTSAWGSAVLRNGGASVKARAELAVIKNTECWNISNWRYNTVRKEVNGTAPWVFVASRFFGGGTVSNAQKKLTVSHLYPAGLRLVNAGSKVHALIDADPNSYATFMLVARLNTLFAGNRVAECVISSSGEDMLLKMGAQGPNVFKPRDSTGAAWGEEQIRNYLYSNYLVRA